MLEDIAAAGPAGLSPDHQLPDLLPTGSQRGGITSRGTPATIAPATSLVEPVGTAQGAGDRRHARQVQLQANLEHRRFSPARRRGESVSATSKADPMAMPPMGKIEYRS